MSTKNPLTLAGIEPATFRFVAQHLNHCATAVPEDSKEVLECLASMLTLTFCTTWTAELSALGAGCALPERKLLGTHFC